MSGSLRSLLFSLRCRGAAIEVDDDDNDDDEASCSPRRRALEAGDMAGKLRCDLRL